MESSHPFRGFLVLRNAVGSLCAEFCESGKEATARLECFMFLRSFVFILTPPVGQVYLIRVSTQQHESRFPEPIPHAVCSLRCFVFWCEISWVIKLFPQALL